MILGHRSVLTGITDDRLDGATQCDDFTVADPLAM
jgi:hypothetical protein